MTLNFSHRPSLYLTTSYCSTRCQALTFSYSVPDVMRRIRKLFSEGLQEQQHVHSMGGAGQQRLQILQVEVISERVNMSEIFQFSTLCRKPLRHLKSKFMDIRTESMTTISPWLILKETCLCPVLSFPKKTT